MHGMKFIRWVVSETKEMDVLRESIIIQSNHFMQIARQGCMEGKIEDRVNYISQFDMKHSWEMEMNSETDGNICICCRIPCLKHVTL
jgi:hypothetical protein